MLNKNESFCECKSSYLTVSDCDCGSSALPCNGRPRSVTLAQLSGTLSLSVSLILRFSRQ